MMHLNARAYAGACPPEMPTRPDPTRPDLILVFISPLRESKSSFVTELQTARNNFASDELTRLGEATDAASCAAISTLDAARRRDTQPKRPLPRVKENRA